MPFLHALLLVIITLFTPLQTYAFEYPSITNPSLFPNSRVNNPQENLIKNPWFEDGCTFSFTDVWKTSSLSVNEADPTYGAPWGPSDKPQDPHYVNCNGDWTGYAARFARNSGQGENEFYENKNAKLWQVVGPVNPNSRNLSFHALIVAHRVNTYKVEIYGCNSQSCEPGTGIQVWTNPLPFDVTCLEPGDCLNNLFGKDYQGVGCNPHPTLGRDCLWEDVTLDILGLSPVQRTISQGFPYYRVQFLMNYPLRDSTSTGNVGGKLARVYFSVSGSGTTPTVSPTPSITPLPSSITDWTDYVQLIFNFSNRSPTDIFDLNQLISQFGS